MAGTDWRKKALALAELFPAEPFREALGALRKNAAAPLAAACSGGADSLCALLLTWANADAASRERLVVLHFDHAVRAESAADADFVRGVAASLGAECVVGRRVAAPGAGEGEASLRADRLAFFAREMRARGAEILVQGHQRDDVAETALMRLARGAGTDGLAAPRAVSRQADGRVFARPLLDFPKERILAALRACGIPWREDSTNAGTDFFRNRVRNVVLPALRKAAPFENIARSRRLAEEDADALDFFAERFLRERWERGRPAVFSGAASPATGTPLLPAVVRRALRRIFAAENLSPGAKNFDALVAAVCAGTPLKFSAGTRSADWDGERLRIRDACEEKGGRDSDFVFGKEIVDATPELFGKIRVGAFPPTETVFLAGTPEIFVRAPVPGERYRPLGAPGEKSVARVFTDKKIPRAERSRLPVFADGTGIAWIPGLPPADRFRIVAPGGKALRLTFRRETLPL